MMKLGKSQLQGAAELQSLINLRIFRQIDSRKTFQVLLSAQMQIQPLAVGIPHLLCQWAGAGALLLLLPEAPGAEPARGRGALTALGGFGLL